jgi:hypothetical protein
MNIEAYLLNKFGRERITNFLNFFSSLIIKVDFEARQFESKESYRLWSEYQRAYEKGDDFYNYTVSERHLLRATFNYGEITAHNLLNPDSLQEYYQNNKDNNKIIRLLNILREEKISTYVEYNSYYNQFLGKPLNESQYIKTTNYDFIEGVTPNNKREIYLHEVKLSLYPQTYSKLFDYNEIKTIIAQYPEFTYLKFIKNPLSVYYVRNSQNFSILYYNASKNDEEELTNFFKIYKENQAYMMTMDYITGFDNRYPVYSYMLETLLLHSTVCQYFTSLLEDYTYNKYTDQDIYDILDSKNLSNLKTIDINILKKIVKHLPDLLEIRGSFDVVNKILDIIGDNSISLKRYYLKKTYSTNSTNQLEFHTDKLYTDSVDLEIEEVLIRKGDRVTEEVGTFKTNEYRSFIEDDLTWGGWQGEMTDVQRQQLKESFRKDLLKMDFSRILTKYLTLSMTIDSLAKQNDTHNLIGLLFQYSNEKDKFLSTDILSFNDIETTPLTIYAAICWCFQILNGVSNPEEIKMDHLTFASIMQLQRTEGISYVGNQIRNHVINIPNALIDAKIEDILGKDIDYSQYVTWFDSNMTLREVLHSYSSNSRIMNIISQGLYKNQNFKEYLAWDYIRKSNITTKRYLLMFENKETFPEYISSYSEALRVYINQILTKEDFSTEVLIEQLLNPLMSTFKKYINRISDGVLSLTDFSSEDNTTNKYLLDLQKIINEFLSIFTTIHKVEFVQDISRQDEQSKLNYLYHYMRDQLEDDGSYMIRLEDKINKMLLEDNDTFFLHKFKIYISTLDILENNDKFDFNYLNYDDLKILEMTMTKDDFIKYNELLSLIETFKTEKIYNLQTYKETWELIENWKCEDLLNYYDYLVQIFILDSSEYFNHNFLLLREYIINRLQNKISLTDNYHELLELLFFDEFLELNISHRTELIREITNDISTHLSLDHELFDDRLINTLSKLEYIYLINLSFNEEKYIELDKTNKIKYLDELSDQAIFKINDKITLKDILLDLNIINYDQNINLKHSIIEIEI